MIRAADRGRGIAVEGLAVALAVCRDVNRILEFRGNEPSNNSWGMLLEDEQEEVVWYTDRGFSVGQVTTLAMLIREKFSNQHME